MKSIVIGASGGIGAALASALKSRGDDVIALSRSSSPAVDYDQPDSVAASAEELRATTPFDRIVVATGVLHGDGVQPEKSLRAIEAEALDRYFRINATGPALVIRHFVGLLPRDRRAVFVVLSARVGSIGDNRLGGWIGYRASKAALNQIVRTAAIELARTHPQAILVGLHPGTVDTPLSAPFQRNLSEGQLLDADDSAARLLAVLDALTPADSGGCFAPDGSRIVP
ncbi:SDR family NAD(P)-dependent oxidoreductase [Sphingomonas sp. LY160]|uniref:SDR family NAD(P)-dependent oxidoreductase n=1 Tax=Sphingomonas sp. LY160 TaxID=3095342 RepID=UPI002ADEDBA7|nr:SDR family NAD(P)-dependent oxidoreductase [Sphingomonas sp. LY160]MEA1072848.1 SDR family NAD(P)-dependent oxidoreductase [Sphingomonas sp. LY160]